MCSVTRLLVEELAGGATHLSVMERSKDTLTSQFAAQGRWNTGNTGSTGTTPPLECFCKRVNGPAASSAVGEQTDAPPTPHDMLLTLMP